MWPVNVHASSRVAIKIHSNYYMVEGTPHMRQINVHGSSSVEINVHSNYYWWRGPLACGIKFPNSFKNSPHNNVCNNLFPMKNHIYAVLCVCT